MTVDDEPLLLRCLTVHSASGGVGRTMMVANLARELATRHKLDVLALDWNLDAPGLHHWFEDLGADAKGRPGLLEYLEASRRELAELGRRGPGAAVGPSLAEHVIMLHESTSGHGKLGLMTAGRLDEHYRRRVGELDWRRSYGSDGGYWIVERLRRQVLDQFQVVIIDAPAGRSDTAAAPLLQMPDVLVMLMTANKQSLIDTMELADELAMHPARGRWARRPLSFLFAHSRARRTDPRFVRWMEGPVRQAFEDLRRRGVLNPDLQGDLHPYLLLDDEPRANVGEFVAGSPSWDGNSPLADSYSRLATLIARLATVSPASRLAAAGDRTGEAGHVAASTGRISRDGVPMTDLLVFLRRELADAHASGDRARVLMILSLLAKVEHAIGEDAAALVHVEQGTRMSAAAGAVSLAENDELRERILDGARFESTTLD